MPRCLYPVFSLPPLRARSSRVCQKAWYGQSNLAAVQHNDAAALLKARSTTITFPVAAAATTVTVT
jgi:hypothetical protein